MWQSIKAASFGLLCTLVASAPAGAASRSTTTVKFAEPVVASGRLLPAGEYSLERVDSSLVAVTQHGEFVALVTGHPAMRTDQGPTTVTVRKAGVAPELDRWFVDGERTGFQFATAASPARMAKPCPASTGASE